MHVVKLHTCEVRDHIKMLAWASSSFLQSPSKVCSSVPPYTCHYLLTVLYDLTFVFFHPIAARLLLHSNPPTNGLIGPQVACAGLTSPVTFCSSGQSDELGHILPMVDIGGSECLTRARFIFSTPHHVHSHFIGQSRLSGQAQL